jgi:protein arginine kinase activator
VIIYENKNKLLQGGVSFTICESCGKNPATIHIKTILNGELAEYAICAECAQKLGYGNLLTGLGRNYSSLLGGFFRDEDEEESGAVRCDCCGSTFDGIARSGKVGCAQCYRVFSGRLLPLIQRIHGSTRHRGKVPGGDLPLPRQQSQLAVMRGELRDAIDTENFEQAAKLRDCIRSLEGRKPGEKMV